MKQLIDLNFQVLRGPEESTQHPHQMVDGRYLQACDNLDQQEWQVQKNFCASTKLFQQSTPLNKKKVRKHFFCHPLHRDALSLSLSQAKQTKNHHAKKKSKNENENKKKKNIPNIFLLWEEKKTLLFAFPS